MNDNITVYILERKQQPRYAALAGMTDDPWLAAWHSSPEAAMHNKKGVYAHQFQVTEHTFTREAGNESVVREEG